MNTKIRLLFVFAIISLSISTLLLAQKPKTHTWHCRYQQEQCNVNDSCTGEFHGGEGCSMICYNIGTWPFLIYNVNNASCLTE